MEFKSSTSSKSRKTETISYTSLHRQSAGVAMYYNSVLLVANEVRRVAGQDHQEITRVYTIYECRMQSTVKPHWSLFCAFAYVQES